jgi:hypothetical protein
MMKLGSAFTCITSQHRLRNGTLLTDLKIE